MWKEESQNEGRGREKDEECLGTMERRGLKIPWPAQIWTNGKERKKNGKNPIYHFFITICWSSSNTKPPLNINAHCCWSSSVSIKPLSTIIDLWQNHHEINTDHWIWPRTTMDHWTMGEPWWLLNPIVKPLDYGWTTTDHQPLLPHFQKVENKV